MRTQTTLRGQSRINNNLTLEDYNNFPDIRLQKVELIGQSLRWENKNGLTKSFQDGFFLLKTPKELNLNPLDEFCKYFYKSKDENPSNTCSEYWNMPVQGEYQGYFDRPHDQWENFYIEQKNWHLLPEYVQKSGKDLNKIAHQVYCIIMDSLGLSESEIMKVSGGLCEGKGHRMLAFNHYRQSLDRRGCKFHRDSGWLTFLRMTQPGLLMFKDNNYFKVLPNEDYLVINYGSTIEVLTAKLDQPIRSVIHGVVNTSGLSRERHSYVLFMDSSLDSQVYQARKGEIIPVQSMQSFAKQETERTYDNCSYL